MGLAGKLPDNQSLTKNTGGRPRIEVMGHLPKLIIAFQNLMDDEEACRFAKIGLTTFYRRMAEGERFWKMLEIEKSITEETENYQEYSDLATFWEKVTNARCYAEDRAKARVLDILVNGSDSVAGPMARWVLEKLEPETYGKNPQIGIYNQQNNTYQFMSDEEFKEQTRREGGVPSAREVIEALEAERLAQEQGLEVSSDGIPSQNPEV